VAHGVRRESRISLQSGRDRIYAPYGPRWTILLMSGTVEPTHPCETERDLVLARA
jgi:hypothetical protein